jgi:hypothetical protein
VLDRWSCFITLQIRVLAHVTSMRRYQLVRLSQLLEGLPVWHAQTIAIFEDVRASQINVKG